MKTVWRLLLFLRPFTGWVMLSIILSTATIASGIGLLGTSADLIARAALQPSIATLQVAIVGVRFFGISRGIFRYLERLTSHSVNFRLLARLRIWLYQTLEPLSPARLQDFSSGDLLNRILGDVDTLENFYVRVVGPYVAAGLAVVGMGLFLGQFAPELGMILIGGMLISGLAIPWLAYVTARGAGWAVVAVRSQLNANLVESLQGISDLTAFNRAGDTVSGLRALGSQLSNRQQKMMLNGSWVNAVNGLVANLTAAAVLWAAIPLVTSGHLAGFLLPVVVMLAAASFEAVAPLTAAGQNLGISLESARRLFEFQKIPHEVTDTADPRPLPSKPWTISLRDIVFQYDKGSDLVLDRYSMDLTPGKKIAVIGPSGAGKTSLTNVLLRLWNYDSGVYSINGMDVNNFQQADIRGSFGVITQSPYLFNATLRQNLRLACSSAGDEEMIRILQKAGLGEWIASLPAGLDTWVGENGLKLSGGERQRLGVARTLLRDTPIVILDEPTANLDAITEAEVIAVLQQSLAGKSVLWITHRLVGLDWMDEIIVLNQGRVVERGTHHELKRTGGFYARLLEVQNQMIPLTFSSPPSS